MRGNFNGRFQSEEVSGWKDIVMDEYDLRIWNGFKWLKIGYNGNILYIGVTKNREFLCLERSFSVCASLMYSISTLEPGGNTEDLYNIAIPNSRLPDTLSSCFNTVFLLR
jgi:hypothetical protein